jgi:hypothetical protein
MRPSERRGPPRLPETSELAAAGFGTHILTVLAAIAITLLERERRSPRKALSLAAPRRQKFQS